MAVRPAEVPIALPVPLNTSTENPSKRNICACLKTLCEKVSQFVPKADLTAADTKKRFGAGVLIGAAAGFAVGVATGSLVAACVTAFVVSIIAVLILLKRDGNSMPSLITISPTNVSPETVRRVNELNSEPSPTQASSPAAPSSPTPEKPVLQGKAAQSPFLREQAARVWDPKTPEPKPTKTPGKVNMGIFA